MFEERSEVGTAPAGNSARWAIGMVVLLVLVIGGMFAYSVHQRTLARQRELEKQQIEQELSLTRQQIDTVTAKLTALSQQQQQQMQLEAQRLQSQLQAQRAAAIRGSRVRTRAEEKRYKELQARLDQQNQAIDQTRTDLSSAKTELSGSIARTHDELVLLQRRGERNYYEFDLDKSKQFTHVGPMGVALRKADTKHQFADLELMVEDTKLQKKHVNLFEPIMFYRPDTQTPVEMVINSVRKNHIHGYISEPKWRASQLQASSNPAPEGSATGSVATNSGPQRQQTGTPELRRRNQQ
jgi:hypothetical protein